MQFKYCPRKIQGDAINVDLINVQNIKLAIKLNLFNVSLLFISITVVASIIIQRGLSHSFILSVV